MKTPLGWARANMMYDMMEKPPKPGSVLEALCLMIQMRRQLIQLYSMHTVVQAVRTAQDDSAETVQDSFKRYQDALMPFLQDEVDREKEEIIQALKYETKRGPLRIKALVSDRESQLRSKLKKTRIKPPSPKFVRRSKPWSSARGAAAPTTTRYL